MPDFTGQDLGRYHIIEKLGEGGMAVVYKAYDTRLECEVAVKVIRTDQLAPAILDRALKRFEREAKAVAKLNHPNIVKVTDFGEHEGSPFLVMPFLSGGTFKSLIKDKGAIPWQDAVKLILPMVEAISYAHNHDVIHRDVKPSNLLLTDQGQPMLTDFGVAKVLEEDATQDLTGTSATVGTPEYMAPEQVTSKSVDLRVDVYSLGVVFYELVTGRRPFEADTPMAVIVKHASEPLPRPSQFVKNLPENVEYFIIKALAKKPENHYQTADEMRKALEGLLSGTNISVSKPVSKKANLVESKKSKKWHLPVLISAGVVILMGVGILVGTQIGKRETNEITVTATASLEPSITPTLEPSPTVTQTMTITMTPKPTQAATPNPLTIEGEFSGTLNCRKGPSESLYGYDYTLNGQPVEITGRNSDSSWIFFKPSIEETECWTKQYLVQFEGDIETLPVVEAAEVTSKILYTGRYAYCSINWSGQSDSIYGGNECKTIPSCREIAIPDATSKQEAYDYIFNWVVSHATLRRKYSTTVGIYEYTAESGYVPQNSIACPVSINGTTYTFLGW